MNSLAADAKSDGHAGRPLLVRVGIEGRRREIVTTERDRLT